MTIWQPTLEDDGKPRYAALADALARDIGAGKLKPGDRLPTHRDLAWSLGVTVGTVSRAYAEAAKRGLTTGEVGRGTYIKDPSENTRHMAFYLDNPGEAGIDLAYAFPPPAIAEETLLPALRDLASDPNILPLFDYQPRPGLKAHRAMGARWLARSGLSATSDSVVVCGGGHHGMTIAMAAITRPGDRILAERLTYPGLKDVAHLLGLRIDGVAMDEEGLCPDAFESACRQGEAKALYCMPTLHNPTNIILSTERRQAIAQIAERYGVAIVEDDVFGLLAPEAPPALASFAPTQGYFVTSLSKTLSPGLRIGFVHGPEAARHRLNNAVRISCWMAPPLCAELAARMVADGSADRLLTAHRAEADARRRLALEILQPWQVTAPPGAIHLWLQLPEPWRGSDFAAQASRRNLGLRPAEPFTIGRHHLTHAVRICLGPPRTRAALRHGLEIIADLLNEGPSGLCEAIV